ncbi:unnamed protein product [Acanthoscelides obtectus]|uniref:Uncharacterized protein n=1 Tax=Acanthoscelides obtectus TaxID=200917 RepID=A0A9P0P531_ACAOB|nr:unnamed protein product [Acanthoscelides obtectus]CAK1629355.1 hypothetical protein AOBTE_LOCUS5699 [Acanthoscelides obtectus]
MAYMPEGQSRVHSCWTISTCFPERQSRYEFRTCFPEAQSRRRAFLKDILDVHSRSAISTNIPDEQFRAFPKDNHDVLSGRGCLMQISLIVFQKDNEIARFLRFTRAISTYIPDEQSRAFPKDNYDVLSGRGCLTQIMFVLEDKEAVLLQLLIEIFRCGERGRGAVVSSRLQARGKEKWRKRDAGSAAGNTSHNFQEIPFTFTSENQKFHCLTSTFENPPQIPLKTLLFPELPSTYLPLMLDLVSPDHVLVSLRNETFASARRQLLQNRLCQEAQLMTAIHEPIEYDVR